MQCTAHRKRDGEQCTKRAVAGSTICRSHGAAAGQIRRAAAVRVAEADARAAWAAADNPPDEDPLRELQRLAGEALAWKDFLRDRITELSSLGYQSAVGEQVRAQVVLYERALDQVTKVLVAVGRLRIDERLAAIDQQIANKVLQAITMALEENNITGHDATEIRDSTVRHLQLLDGGDAA